jgi:hypothetical protein
MVGRSQGREDRAEDIGSRVETWLMDWDEEWNTNQ